MTEKEATAGEETVVIESVNQAVIDVAAIAETGSVNPVEIVNETPARIRNVTQAKIRSEILVRIKRMTRRKLKLQIIKVKIDRVIREMMTWIKSKMWPQKRMMIKMHYPQEVKRKKPNHPKKK